MVKNKSSFQNAIRQEKNEHGQILLKLQEDTGFLLVAIMSANGGAASTGFYSNDGSENTWRKKNKGRK